MKRKTRRLSGKDLESFGRTCELARIFKQIFEDPGLDSRETVSMDGKRRVRRMRGVCLGVIGIGAAGFQGCGYGGGA